MRTNLSLGVMLLFLVWGSNPAPAPAQDGRSDEAPAPRSPRRATRPAPVDDDDDATDSPAPTQARRGPASTPIGSHQIDRYEAIRQLRQSVKTNPDSLADWVILGELAHEVALDLPSDQDDPYYQLSRSAYEHALRLDPNNSGLRAAVQLARDQETNAADFDDNRMQGVRTYLDARRREVAATGYAPTIRIFKTATLPPDDSRSDLDDPAPISRQAKPVSRTVSYPTYQPYSPSQGKPVTYQQYSDSFAPPPAKSASPTPTTTLRGLADELPGAFLNDLRRGSRGAAASSQR